MRPSLPQKIKEEEGEEMYFFQVLGMRDDIHQNFAKIVSSHWDTSKKQEAVYTVHLSTQIWYSYILINCTIGP